MAVVCEEIEGENEKDKEKYIDFNACNYIAFKCIMYFF